MTDTNVVVTTKSAWLSKINWTQAAGIVFTGLAMFGLDLSAEQKADVVAGAAVAVQIVTWVMRTFFTKTITHASAG